VGEAVGKDVGVRVGKGVGVSDGGGDGDGVQVGGTLKGVGVSGMRVSVALGKRATVSMGACSLVFCRFISVTASSAITPNSARIIKARMICWALVIVLSLPRRSLICSIHASFLFLSTAPTRPNLPVLAHYTLVSGGRSSRCKIKLGPPALLPGV